MSGANGNGHRSISRTAPLADLPELMTPAEVRAFLGVGRGTVYELLRVPKSALSEFTGARS